MLAPRRREGRSISRFVIPLSHFTCNNNTFSFSFSLPIWWRNDPLDLFPFSFFFSLIEKRIADCTGCSSCWHLSLSTPQLSITCCTSSSAVVHFFLSTLEIKKRERTQGVNGSWQSAWDATQLRAWDGPSWMRTSSGKTKDQNLFHPPTQKDTRMEIYQSADFDPYRCDVLVGSRLPATVFDRSAKILAPFYFLRAPRWENKEPIEWIAAASISPQPTPYGKAKEAETTKRNFSIRRPFPLNIITYAREKEWKSYSREREELEAYQNGALPCAAIPGGSSIFLIISKLEENVC